MVKLLSTINIFILFFIYAISNVSCTKTCLSLYEKCNNNEDCCTNVCKHFMPFFKGTCAYDERRLDAANITVVPESDYVEEPLMSNCTYYREKNESLRAEMFERFGVNAAHATILPDSKTLVSIRQKFVPVTINDLFVRDPDDMALYLSDEAAEALGITEEGTIPCNVIIPNDDYLENYLKCFLYFLPFIILSSATLMFK